MELALVLIVTQQFMTTEDKRNPRAPDFKGKISAGGSAHNGTFAKAWWLNSKTCHQNGQVLQVLFMMMMKKYLQKFL